MAEAGVFLTTDYHRCLSDEGRSGHSIMAKRQRVTKSGVTAGEGPDSASALMTRTTASVERQSQ